MSNINQRLVGAMAIACVLVAGSSAQAQAMTEASATPAVATAVAPAATIELPEGAELRIRFNEKLSSATAAAGDRFTVTLDEPIQLSNGVVIPAGYRGLGEVTVADKKGFMGKAGQLNVRLDYLRIGDTRVRLRASKGQEGKGAMGATIALTVLFGPLGLLKRGHDIEIQPGQSLIAYVDSPTIVPTPLAPPPVN